MTSYLSQQEVLAYIFMIQISWYFYDPLPINEDHKQSLKRYVSNYIIATLSDRIYPIEIYLYQNLKICKWPRQILWVNRTPGLYDPRSQPCFFTVLKSIKLPFCRFITPSDLTEDCLDSLGIISQLIAISVHG